MNFTGNSNERKNFKYFTKMKWLSILFIGLFSLSCRVPRVDLSEKEEELQEALRDEFHCKGIELKHDYKAITANRKDGQFSISLCSDFCQIDSISSVRKANEISRKLRALLSHSINYSFFVFYSSKTKKIDDITSKLVCDKVIKISVRDFKLINYKVYKE